MRPRHVTTPPTKPYRSGYCKRHRSRRGWIAPSLKTGSREPTDTNRMLPGSSVSSSSTTSQPVVPTDSGGSSLFDSPPRFDPRGQRVLHSFTHLRPPLFVPLKVQSDAKQRQLSNGRLAMPTSFFRTGTGNALLCWQTPARRTDARAIRIHCRRCSAHRLTLFALNSAASPHPYPRTPRIYGKLVWLPLRLRSILTKMQQHRSQHP